MKPLIKVSLLFILILIIFSFGTFFYYQKSLRQRQPGPTQTLNFVVNEGEPTVLVADRLQRQKLISSSWLFRIYLRLGRPGASVQAGYYMIPQNLTLEEVVEILQHGRSDLKLTFPEGWRREEMAFYLKSTIKSPAVKIAAEDFLKETEGDEGYLFPDTYFVPAWYTTSQLVEMMKVNFEKKFSSLPKNKNSLSKEEIIILASIIEREAKFSEDRPIIAGILLKRLKNGWSLDVDATLQYFVANSIRQLADKNQKPASLKSDRGESKLETIDWWPRELTTDDLKLDSPYNTRKYKGLPPTPISNPGLSTLEAVARPTESKYWFYLSDQKGQIHYAVTLEEHNLNIRQYLVN